VLTFEGVVGYSVSEPEEADHFFEHTLGLELGAQDGALRFYPIGNGLTLTVDISGVDASASPYLLFSAEDVAAAADHFVERGCQVRPLSWAPEGSGFIARAPEGHAVAVIDVALLNDDEGASEGT
jgi:catechol 2,3-dioxygenase-like lactoylglutathione lyase family enzyme